MAARVITERVTAPFTGVRVTGTDEAPVIEGVLLCGPVSANRRRYLRAAFEGERVNRYNGAPVNLNHGRDNSGRPYETQIGIVQNARHRADGMPIGDIAVNPEKPYAKAFVWDARHQPKACGMSHVAKCETAAARDGWEDVTEVVTVESVDVIGAKQAATTTGLDTHESKGSAVGKISLKQFAERVGPKLGPDTWGAMKKLAEDFGDELADAPVIDEPAGEETTADLKSGLMAALTPMLEDAFDSGDSEKVCAAVRDFIKLHAKHTGKGGEEKKDEPPADDKPKDESKRPTLATLFAECKTAGVTETTPELLEALAETASPTARAFMLRQHRESKANAAAEKPKGGHRAPGAGETTGGRKVEAKEPAEEYAWVE